MCWLALVIALGACGRIDFDSSVRGDAAASSDVAETDGASTNGWHLVQTQSSDNSTTVSPVSPITPGDLVMVAAQFGGADSVSGVSDGTSNTYQSATAKSTDSIGDGLQLWFTFATTSAPTITLTLASAPTPQTLVLWEFSGVKPGTPTQNAANNGVGVTPVSSSFMTTIDGELMVSAVIAQHSATLTAGAFTQDQNDNMNSWVHLASNSAPIATYQVTWTQTPSGAFCSASALWLPAP